MEEIRAVGKEGKKELAVDLEHHETRSWWGITCLMQVRLFSRFLFGRVGEKLIGLMG